MAKRFNVRSIGVVINNTPIGTTVEVSEKLARKLESDGVVEVLNEVKPKTSPKPKTVKKTMKKAASKSVTKDK